MNIIVTPQPTRENPNPQPQVHVIGGLPGLALSVALIGFTIAAIAIMIPVAVVGIFGFGVAMAGAAAIDGLKGLWFRVTHKGLSSQEFYRRERLRRLTERA